MPKSKKTENIENALHAMCRDKRLYGCEEVTIGFPNNGYGNEIVDFMLMDSKGILGCYEIKVSVSDLSSRAKKSWYGNYNYLVATETCTRKSQTGRFIFQTMWGSSFAKITDCCVKESQ